jgi:hypothetical protein
VITRELQRPSTALLNTHVSKPITNTNTTFSITFKYGHTIYQFTKAPTQPILQQSAFLSSFLLFFPL